LGKDCLHLGEKLKTFFVGQRWLSETEPELGLGIID
jgi:hypothetical protein